MKTGIRKATKYLLRQAAKGDTRSHAKLKKVLASKLVSIHAGSMITFADADDGKNHPNKMPFKGVLLIVDAPSTKPPHGSRGHRIWVSKETAQKKLSGLIGMAVNYDSKDLDSHDTRHKVGIVDKAWIKGDQVWVSGFVWKKDFPEAQRDLKQGGLGMSMELADVYVRDEDEDVWHLVDFEFTGATILKKTDAAYYQTELAAATAVAAASGCKGEKKMAKTEQRVKRVAAAGNGSGNGALLVGAIKSAFSEAMVPVVAELKAANERSARLSDDLEELKGLHMIAAAAEVDEDEDEYEIEAAKDEEEDDDMEAGKAKDEEDPSDPSDKNDDDEGEDDNLEAQEDLEIDPVEMEPGDVNEDSSNRGDKTTVGKKPTQGEHMPGNIAKKRLKSQAMKANKKMNASKPFPNLKSGASIQAAAVQIQTLAAQAQRYQRAFKKATHQLEIQASEHRKEIKKLKGAYKQIEVQAEKWSEQIDRKSAVPREISNLLAKGGYNVRELQASGEKLTVGAVDALFGVLAESGVSVDTTMRATYKNRMCELGFMENGTEGYTN